jgi:hypothetical protein
MKKEFKVFTKEFYNQKSYEEWVSTHNLDISIADYEDDDPKTDVIFRPQISGSGVFQDEVIVNAPEWIFQESTIEEVEY